MTTFRVWKNHIGKRGGLNIFLKKEGGIKEGKGGNKYPLRTMNSACAKEFKVILASHKFCFLSASI